MSKDIDPQEKRCSRREFLSTALAAPIFTSELSSSFQSNNVSVASPDGKVRFELLPGEKSRLSYRVTFGNRPVIEASALGIVIDGVDLGQGAENGGENTLDEVKNFSRLAGQLGFEYQVVEGFWQRWSEEQMREAVDFSRQQKVGLLFWKHSRDLRTPEERKQFFGLCRRIGVVGAKIDFFDHEAKETIDLYQTLLRDAAEHKLIVDFHGANKPAGEARSWPNEMTREGIYGLEHRRTPAWGPVNTMLPFTRMLAGHADYTPVHFGERRKETSWAHQIASAAIFTSPLLIYGAHPKNILANPAVEIIKSIPAVWDETIALPASEIGELAAFARRNGSMWFLAVMNGSTAKTIKIPLSFLGAGKYQAILARDQQAEAAAVKVENAAASRGDSLALELRAGGGFIARFAK